MSNYHILGCDDAANAYTVIFHLSVTSASNNAGVNYRDAIVAYQGGSPINSAVPHISASEQADLDSGILFEVSEKFNSNPNQTLVNKRDALDARFSALQSEYNQDFQDILGYWGYDRDVP